MPKTVATRRSQRKSNAKKRPARPTPTEPRQIDIRPEPPSLPNLKVAVFREDTFDRFVEMADPRAQFVKTYNELAFDLGTHAEPWDDDEPEDCRVALCRQHDVDDLEIVQIVKFGDSVLCSLGHAIRWIAETHRTRHKSGDPMHAVILPPASNVRGPKGGAA